MEMFELGLKNKLLLLNKRLKGRGKDICAEGRKGIMHLGGGGVESTEA